MTGKAPRPRWPAQYITTAQSMAVLIMVRRTGPRLALPGNIITTALLETDFSQLTKMANTFSRTMR
jgi:hypothetical protein